MYIGNFGAEHSTENHVARALEHNGHTVIKLQEARAAWPGMAQQVQAAEPDFVLWTTTYDYAKPATFDDQRRMLATVDVPTVAYHLDLWWGLDREHRIHESPFFRCDLVCTADGGHEDEWTAAGITHAWFPPAVSLGECELGTRRDEFRSDVVFVGSWQGSYHAESAHRHDLVAHLRRRGDCTFWPRPGEDQRRGKDLRDLYASTGVAVGDSCMVPRYDRYWSDRVPETMGRGGFLLHPHVEGVEDEYPDLVTWPAGDWAALDDLIDHYVANPDERAKVAAINRDHVLAHHTYEVRMRELVDTMRGMDLL